MQTLLVQQYLANGMVSKQYIQINLYIDFDELHERAREKVAREQPTAHDSQVGLQEGFSRIADIGPLAKAYKTNNTLRSFRHDRATMN